MYLVNIVNYNNSRFKGAVILFKIVSFSSINAFFICFQQTNTVIICIYHATYVPAPPLS